MENCAKNHDTSKFYIMSNKIWPHGRKC